MVFIVHGAIPSTCTARVVSAFLAMGLEADKEFKLENHAFPDIKTPQWLEHQPFGQMPWMEDTENGVELFESRAIVRSKIKSPLAPTADNLAAYAKSEQASQNEAEQFAGPAGILGKELVFAKWHGVQPNLEAVEKAKATLTTKLQVYDRILSKQKYLGGDNLTLADFSHLPYGAIVANTGAVPALTDGSLPNVARWWTEITTHSAWVQTKALGRPDHGKA